MCSGQDRAGSAHSPAGPSSNLPDNPPTKLVNKARRCKKGILLIHVSNAFGRVAHGSTSLRIHFTGKCARYPNLRRCDIWIPMIGIKTHVGLRSGGAVCLWGAFVLRPQAGSVRGWLNLVNSHRAEHILWRLEFTLVDFEPLVFASVDLGHTWFYRSLPPCLRMMTLLQQWSMTMKRIATVPFFALTWEPFAMWRCGRALAAPPQQYISLRLHLVIEFCHPGWLSFSAWTCFMWPSNPQASKKKTKGVHVTCERLVQITGAAHWTSLLVLLSYSFSSCMFCKRRRLYRLCVHYKGYSRTGSMDFNKIYDIKWYKYNLRPDCLHLHGDDRHRWTNNEETTRHMLTKAN